MKIVLILGFLASLAAAAVQFMVRSSLLEARETKDRLNRETLQLHADTEAINETLAAHNDEIVKTHDNAKNEQLVTRTLNSEIRQKEEQIAALKAEIENIETRKAQMNADIRLALGDAGTPQQVMEEVDAIKLENEQKVKELETLNQEVEVARREATRNQELVNRLQAQQTARDKAIALGSRTGTVSVVNPEYGFAVVNLGQNHGVTQETRLIVKRGTQFVGRLNIVRIEATRTFADLDPRSVGQILPGDEVIFENASTASR